METDVAKIGSLLSRMTSEKTANEIKLSPAQVQAVVEVLVPRILTQMPGMPTGMKCEIVEKGETTWTFKVERPK